MGHHPKSVFDHPAEPLHDLNINLQSIKTNYVWSTWMSGVTIEESL